MQVIKQLYIHIWSQEEFLHLDLYQGAHLHALIPHSLSQWH